MPAKDEQSLLGQQGAPTIMRHGNDTERSPFLDKPVVLTPAWEARNLPNDELNFKGMTMERANLEISPPHDKYKLIFLTFVIHGLGTLIPWNMFITAKGYFVKFKMDESYIGYESSYATNFLSYLGFAAQIPNLIFNWVNVFVQLGGNLTTRIVWSIMIEVVIFIITVVLAMTDSSEWPGAFFWLTMATVVAINMANGIYQNSVFGMVANLPPKYTGAVILGANIGGTFASVVSVLSTTFSTSYRTAAIYYFITAMFVLLVCFDTYFALPLNKFYRYHEMLREKEAQKQKTESGHNCRTYWTVFKQASPQLFNVFMVFFVTLSVFPSVNSDIKVSDPENFPVPEKLYVDATCFLTFNICAMLGSLITSWVKWPKKRYLFIPIVLRIVFIPLFLFCNYRPKNIVRVLPVYINNDWAYWSIGVLMALSSGYLSSLAMMYAPTTVKPQYSSIAGMFAAAMLITGILAGILFSMLFPLIVSNVSW